MISIHSLLRLTAAKTLRRSKRFSSECKTPSNPRFCQTVPSHQTSPPLHQTTTPKTPIFKNPCIPSHPPGNYKKYQLLSALMAAAAGFQFWNVWKHPSHATPCCKDYEYMYIRTKRFPWGKGVKSLFHNGEVNCLPADARDKN